MFEKKQETEDVICAVLAILAKYGRGDVVPHFELSQAVGAAPPESRYYQLVRRARDRHRAATGQWTREVPGVGYRFLTFQQSLTDEQRDRRKRMRRHANIGHAVAGSIPDAELTEHERKLKQHVIESHARLRKEILSEERHEKWLLRPAVDKPMRLAR